MCGEPAFLPQRTRADFAAVSSTPRAARAFVRVTLRAWDVGRLIEAAEVITSELVTNAVKATRVGARPGDGPGDPAAVGVELRLDEEVLRIAVRDGGTGRPALRTGDGGAEAEDGRGLLLVDVLSVRWDVDFLAGGKVTWAELETTDKEHA